MGDNKNINIKSLNGVTICSQNVNSLNLSSINESMLNRKIRAITDSNNDIIFISDVRANGKENKLEKKFLYASNPYLLYMNSTDIRRGVAILINKNLNCEVIRTYKDLNQNILGIKSKINNELVLLLSVYGPNTDRSNTFYQNLQGIINSSLCQTIILGGDLNTTLDPSRITGPQDSSNLDLFNMNNNINPANGELLRKLLRENNMIDPFRIKNPYKRDYSYVPFSVMNKNRSRIDYIFCSSSLLNLATVHYDIKRGRVFDHKPVIMRLGGTNKKSHKVIDPNLLNNAEIKETALLTTYNTYSTYIDGHLPWEHELVNVYRLKERNKEIKKVLTETLIPRDDVMQNLCIELVNNQNMISNLISALPEIEHLSNLERSIDADLFLTVLSSNLLNNVTSTQASIKNTNLELKKTLGVKLNQLKTDMDSNFEEIIKLETKLSNIIDDELDEKLEKSKLFENLRFEKNSSNFNRIFKASKNGESVNKIKRKEGTDFVEFDNRMARDNYIKNFYGDIYMRQNLPNITIEEFLGENVCNKQEVIGKKLNEGEKESLERNITLDELEKSLLSANPNSAPGLDGLNNKALKSFWPFIKFAILKGLNTMIDKGKLTDLLRLGGIRLIPKKGGLEDISNWRPISLLSVIYKLLSGVLTKRVEPFIDKICSPGQKGYSRKKRLHDSLINVVELISICSQANIDLIVICVDFKKAFDSVDKSFIFKCLEFFNFGPYFRKLVTVCLEDRKGCIITDQGFTPNFNIEQGVPQGDRLSPYLFIICIEVLLIKIEYSENLTSPVVQNYPEPRKFEGFADDITVNLAANAENLKYLNEILLQFGLLSGLMINSKKTKVLLVSNNPIIYNEIISAADILQFSVVDEVDLLGFKIFKDPRNLTKNWNKVIEKITNKISMWKIYNLSIQGRIIVSKTHLLSQVQFYGTVLPLPNEVNTTISKLIESYVQGGGSKLAKDKLYAKMEDGGLNLIMLEPFCNALKCGLIKHTKTFTDWWSEIFLRRTVTPFIDNINPLGLDEHETPVIACIAKAWQTACVAFYNCGSNIKKAPVINNPLILFNGRMITKVGNRINWLNNLERLKLCRVSDFLDPVTNRPASLDNVNNNLGTNLGALEYMEIRGWLGQLLRKHNDKLNLPTTNFNDFLFKPAKGTKKIRQILQNEDRDIRNHNFTRYFTAQLEVNIEHECKLIFPTWGASYLGYELSNFIFRYVNNGINTRDRLSHFSNVNPNCPLCISTGTVPIERDSIIHAFSECKSVNKLWDDYFKWINLDQGNVNIKVIKLIGYAANSPTINRIINIDLFLVRFFIMKIRNLCLKLINFGALKTFMLGNRTIFAAISAKYRAGLGTTAVSTDFVFHTS